jgi:hypothetical protein
MNKKSKNIWQSAPFFVPLHPIFRRHRSSRDETRRDESIKPRAWQAPKNRVYEKISEENLSELVDSYPDVPQRWGSQKWKRKFRAV